MMVQVDSSMRDRLLNWFGWGVVVLLVSCGTALGQKQKDKVRV